MDELINFFNGYDIIFIYETCLKPNHPYDSGLRDFESICISRTRTNRKSKRGCGGLMFYLRKEISSVQQMPGLMRSEDGMCIKLSAKYLGFEKDLYTGLVYVSPEISCHPASRENLWNTLEEDIAIYSTLGNVILTGDFNARTSSLPDYYSKMMLTGSFR